MRANVAKHFDLGVCFGYVCIRRIVMAAGDRNREPFDQQDVPEEYSFDELAKRVASGTISRSGALKMAGAAILGALFAGSVAIDEAEAETERKCRGKAAISNRRCPGEEGVCRQREDQICNCAKTVEGDTRCVDITNENCPATDECDRSRDCPGSQLCIEVGACCEGSRRNLCVRPCR
jgi:hypothetical protein